MNIAVAIERNRAKLFRMVTGWLIAAMCMRRVLTVLPRRIGTWVCMLILKAEVPTGYLIIACGYEAQNANGFNRAFIDITKHYEAGVEPIKSADCTTLGSIIARLKALRSALKYLA